MDVRILIGGIALSLGLFFSGALIFWRYVWEIQEILKKHKEGIILVPARVYYPTPIKDVSKIKCYLAITWIIFLLGFTGFFTIVMFPFGGFYIINELLKAGEIGFLSVIPFGIFIIFSYYINYKLYIRMVKKNGCFDIKSKSVTIFLIILLFNLFILFVFYVCTGIIENTGHLFSIGILFLIVAIVVNIILLLSLKFE